MLKDPNDKAGVSATFTSESNLNANKLLVGQSVTLKGVIRSGAAYDADFEIYENLIIDKVMSSKNNNPKKISPNKSIKNESYCKRKSEPIARNA